MSILLRHAAASTTAPPANYIEDVFSTYLYNGNGSTQTITNGIDLSGKGGMTWVKSRSAATNNFLFDTSRGALNEINSNNTEAQASLAASLTAFNANGFSLGAAAGINVNAATYASWTFRKQPKFFDVVTYTGNGSGVTKTISHNLGSAPACIFVKKTNTSQDWLGFHKNTSQPHNKYLILNSTVAEQNYDNIWGENGYLPTTTEFKVSGYANDSGATYVAYLFAHNAGGFGATGTDNVISCGSYNGTGSSTVSVSLGYEPQWVLIKKFSGSTFTDGSASWCIFDNMRGIPTGGSDACLYANLSGAEDSEGTANFINVTATGFEVPPTGNLTNQASCSYIYIAIRRPNKPPTAGTQVYNAIARTGTGAAATVTGVGFAPDASIIQTRSVAYGGRFLDRLRNSMNDLYTTGAEESIANSISAWGMDGITVGLDSATNGSGITLINHFFKRAAGFFDVVCYTAAGTTYNPLTLNHNLGVAPELYIVKPRTANNSYSYWIVGSPLLGNTYNLVLHTTGAKVNNNFFTATAPTSTQFTVQWEMNTSGNTYVTYLFATLAGVSKVGSYTGNGSSQTINCGFTTGARFVLIKRTDDGSTGDWFVWDTSRGIVAGNDPYLLLNSTAAEVTTNDSIDPDASGFIVNQLAATNINVTSASYIFLAIA